MLARLMVRLFFADGALATGRSGCAVRTGGVGAFQPLSRQASGFDGTITLPDVPNGTTSFELSVTGQEFWDQSEGFSLIFAFGNPLLIGGGGLLLRQSVTGTMFTGLLISLDLAVPRLKDVTSSILPRISSGFQVFDFSTDVLGHAFPRAATTMVSPWSLYFFQWIGGRSIIGVYVPTSAIPIIGKYIFFFKPPKHAGFTVKTVAEIYLTDAAAVNHQMLANLELARSNSVFCFLFGESGNPEVIASASVLSNILTEVDRMLRAGRQLSVGSGIHSVALASFSEGGRLMNNVLAGLNGSRLASTLKGIFVFDSWFGEGQLQIFRGRIRSWFANGAQGRVLRIYQGNTVTDPDLFTARDQPRTNGADGTVQKIIGDAVHPSYFYLKMTDAFLRHNARGVVPPNDLHHAVPKLFLSHAIRTTTF